MLNKEIWLLNKMLNKGRSVAKGHNLIKTPLPLAATAKAKGL